MHMSDQIRMPGFIVEVERKRVKNVNLRVYPRQGRVVVSCPTRLPMSAVESFVIRKNRWITKKLKSSASNPLKKEEVLTDGSRVFLWGDSKLLAVKKSDYRNSVERVTNSSVEILTKYPFCHANLEAVTDEYYRREMKEVLPGLIQKWEPKMSVSVADFGVKKMKTRWGTCNIRHRRIWLNLHLAKWPVDCLEFVVVHEMVHLLERLHSKRFYQLMDSFLPDWRDREATLKNFFRNGSC